MEQCLNSCKPEGVQLSIHISDEINLSYHDL